MTAFDGAVSHELLQRALGLHRAGHLAEAEQLYRELAQTHGVHRFETLHMLGVIKAQLGQHNEALELLGQALQMDDRSAAALSNYGNVLASMGRPLQALAYYERALASNPRHAGALKGRADSMLGTGRIAEARSNYTQSLACRPDDPDALNGRGNTFYVEERFAEALTDYERAIALDPHFAEALTNRGLALFRLERYQQAVYAFDQSLALRPNDTKTLNQKGIALRRLGKSREALACHDAALAADPTDPDTHNNRAFTLHHMGQLETARNSYNAALAMNGNNPEVLTNRGTVMRDMGLHELALADFDHAIRIDPEHANAHWNKAVSKLLLGQFDEGWSLYEWRKRLPLPVEARSYAAPALTGADNVSGKTVFVYAGQGLGDTIQFWRFARILKERGARVIVSLQDCLVRLLMNCDPEIMVCGASFVPAHFDYHIALPSLPLVLNRGGNVLTQAGPYIHAEAALAAHWRNRLGRHGFKIGIAWQGAIGFDNGRAIPAAEFARLASIPDVRLISLQKDPDSMQMASMPEIETLEDPFDAGEDAFVDTAAVMQNLDLVITLDSAVAHLSGAMGRHVRIAFRAVPDWRWQLSRADSPWYPTARLFRQPNPGDWHSVFSEVAATLTGRARGI